MAGKKQLTDEGVRKLRAPKSGRVEIGDALQPGLALRVSHSGVKSWSVVYKVPGERGFSPAGRPLKGKQHRYTIGQFPLVGVRKAREQAREILDVALAGRDPAPEKREAILQRHTNTVEAVAKRLVNNSKTTVESWSNLESVLRLHVLPEWGKLPMDTLRQADVHALLDALAEDGKQGTAREVRKHLSKLFNFAVEKEIIPANPMAGMRRRDLQRKVRERSLSDNEIRALWIASGELGYPFGSAVRLLLLTGQRRSDWGDAHRSEIDVAERWLSIPMARYKSRRGHIVPLCGEAWRIVESLPRWNAPDAFLFSTTAGEKAVAGWSKAKAALDGKTLAQLRKLTDDPKAELTPFTIHDLRRTCETRLAMLGVKEETRDAVLGHAKRGLQRTYNKHDYMEEKRAALDMYAKHVMKVVG